MNASGRTRARVVRSRDSARRAIISVRRVSSCTEGLRRSQRLVVAGVDDGYQTDGPDDVQEGAEGAQSGRPSLQRHPEPRGVAQHHSRERHGRRSEEHDCRVDPQAMSPPRGCLLREEKARNEANRRQDPEQRPSSEQHRNPGEGSTRFHLGQDESQEQRSCHPQQRAERAGSGRRGRAARPHAASSEVSGKRSEARTPRGSFRDKVSPQHRHSAAPAGSGHSPAPCRRRSPRPCPRRCRRP